MTYTNEMMMMIAKFLFGEYTANTFCEEFETRFRYVYDDFLSENKKLCEFLDDEVAYICAFYDINGTNESGLYKEDEFRDKISEAYREALPLAHKKKVS